MTNDLNSANTSNDLNRTIVISGEDAVKQVRNLTQLHFWRSQAQMKTKYGMSPRRGWTIRTFNDMYGTSAKTWADIAKLSNDMLQDIRTK